MRQRGLQEIELQNPSSPSTSGISGDEFELSVKEKRAKQLSVVNRNRQSGKKLSVSKMKKDKTFSLPKTFVDVNGNDYGLREVRVVLKRMSIKDILDYCNNNISTPRISGEMNLRGRIKTPTKFDAAQMSPRQRSPLNANSVSLNAYKWFVKDNRLKILREFYPQGSATEPSYTEIDAEVKRRWKRLTVKQREKYFQIAKLDLKQRV